MKQRRKGKRRPQITPPPSPTHLGLLPLGLQHLNVQVLHLAAGGGPVHGADVPVLLEVVVVLLLQLDGASSHTAADGP